MQYIFKDENFNKPFFSTYVKTTMFMLYLLGFIFWKPWRDQCSSKPTYTVSSFMKFCCFYCMYFWNCCNHFNHCKKYILTKCILIYVSKYLRILPLFKKFLAWYIINGNITQPKLRKAYSDLNVNSLFFKKHVGKGTQLSCFELNIW